MWLGLLRCRFLRAMPLPVPGQEVVDPLGGMILQAPEHVGEPSVWVDMVELGALNKRHCYRAAETVLAWTRQNFMLRRCPRTVCGDKDAGIGEW